MQYEPILRKNMPELDSVRGLAILGVIFYHGFFWLTDSRHFTLPEKMFVWAMWPGRMGVNLFFVLSGFLITGLLIDSRNREDYYKRFYVRRALRILPAYYAILALLILIRLASWPFVGLSAIYLSNLTPLFGVAMAYPVLWSLAVEEHFYLLWPTFVRNLSFLNLAACSMLIITLSPLFRLVSFILYRNNGFVDFVFTEFTWNASDGLASGALVAIGLRRLDIQRYQLRRVAFACVAAGMLVFVGCLPFGIWTSQKPIGAMLLVTAWNIIFVGLLILFLLIGTSRWKSLVSNRYLWFFGEISYGLYLVHLLLFSAYDALVRHYFPTLRGSSGFSSLCLRFLIAATASIGLAYMSRRWFENPFLRLKDRFM
jgi:peptidoglycan/LPS O-acetylase OafA/YrhL